MLEPSIAMRRDLTRLIRRHRPEVVLTAIHRTFYGTTLHEPPDHGRLRVALDAVSRRGHPSDLPRAAAEGLETARGAPGVHPRRGAAGYLRGHRGDLDVKLAALRAHKSQMAPVGAPRDDTQWAASRAGAAS